jgi:hypothetical protein
MDCCKHGRYRYMGRITESIQQDLGHDEVRKEKEGKLSVK